jgi:hypothetical protein
MDFRKSYIRTELEKLRESCRRQLSRVWLNASLNGVGEERWWRSEARARAFLLKAFKHLQAKQSLLWVSANLSMSDTLLKKCFEFVRIDS